MAERLRVGILCDGLVFQHWQAECIRQVLAVRGVDPVVLIVHDKVAAEKRKPTMKHALYRWFKKNRLRAKALAADDMTNVLAGIPTLRCRPIGPSSSQRFEADDLAAIKGYAPDVLLRFGFNILNGEILTLPTHGIWSYHHGDEEHYRGRPVGFWEIMQGNPGYGCNAATPYREVGRRVRAPQRLVPHRGPFPVSELGPCDARQHWLDSPGVPGTLDGAHPRVARDRERFRCARA
jgi:hypothetical protein